MSQLFLGIDIGTSSMKSLLISSTGEVFARSEVPIHTEFRENGIAEQAAQDYLQAFKTITEKIQEYLPKVVGIGLSGHTPSLVCINGQGRPTYPVLTWQDKRATREADYLSNSLGDPLPHIGTSLPWAPSACLPKLAWLKRNEPGVLERTRWLLQPKDFLGFHLTGQAISDPWSSKGLVNVLTLEPVHAALELIGCDASIIPEIQQGCSSRGAMSEKACKEFGFPKMEIPVSTGWSDAMSGMLSMGIFAEPSAFMITGTSGIVGISTTTPPSDGKNLYIIPSTCAPISVVYGPTQASGQAIKWFGKILDCSPDELLELSKESKSTSLPIFLPYIDGERAPLWRSDIRGSFFYLSSEHSDADLAKSVMEGISLGERNVLAHAEELLGVRSATIKLGGHAGNDARWAPIRLQTLGTDLECFIDVDSTTRGSAMLACAAAGESLGECYSAMKSVTALYNIDPSLTSYADEKFRSFLEVTEFAILGANSKRRST
jgi:xylulokinase